MCHSQKVTVTLYSIFSRAVGYIHPVAQTGICCKRVCWKFQCNVTMVKLQLFVRPPSRHAPVNKHLLHCGKVAGSQPLACLCEHRENEENTLEQSSISNKKSCSRTLHINNVFASLASIASDCTKERRPSQVSTECAFGSIPILLSVIVLG